jgi:DNA-3-methyladenine glycosylase
MRDTMRMATVPILLNPDPAGAGCGRATCLPIRFYGRDTRTVARELLGKWLVCDQNGSPRIGRIVETEAYLGTHDRACHSARGRTPRTEVMFGPPGRAYVYRIYGMYDCVNVVTEPVGCAAAVLIRAVEPVLGILGRTDGPGRLCRAMAIDRSLNGADLRGPALRIHEPPGPAAPFQIASRPRIGVDYAGRWARRLLRFTIRGNRFVSRA